MVKNRLAGKLVYLAGGMEYVDDMGQEWRDYITPFLHHLQIGVFNPCIMEQTTIREKIAPYIKKAKAAQTREEDLRWRRLAKEKVKHVASEDLNAVDLSTFIILHVDTDTHMCGSYNEQTHACLQRKPVIVHCKQGWENVPGWLWTICEPEMFFSTWKEVEDYIDHIAFAEKIDTLNRWKFFDNEVVYGECSQHVYK